MQFSDTTYRIGIIQDCEDLLSMDAATISGTNNTLYQFTRFINGWYSKVVSWIWEATGDWEYDDSNHTDLPIATATLVASQEDYSLPTTAQKILRVEVKNANGDYYVVSPIDQSEIGISYSEFEETAGLPKYYDIIGNSLILKPAPSSTDVTMVAGLKLHFSREIDYFIYSDITQEPGFDERYHRILSYGASLDYATAKNLIEKIPIFTNRILELKNELQTFFGGRHQNFGIKIRPKKRRIL